MSFEITRQLPGTQFGSVIGLKGGGDAHAVIEAAEKSPNFLAKALAECEGLMVLKGIDAIANDPEFLVRISQLFGPEVEDYRQTLTRAEAIHTGVPAIMLVSNIPPTSRKPP